MKKFLSIPLVLALASSAVTAQDATVGKGGASVKDNAGWTTEVKFYSPSIVRVSKYPGEKAPEKRSYSVIMQPETIDLTTSKNGGATTLKSSSICAIIGKDGKVAFTDINGKPLLSETTWSHTPCENKVDEGKFKVSQSYSLDPEEIIFGLGQRQCPELNQRGQDIRIWTGNTNITIPYIASEKGYGLYWDNAGDSRFTDRDNIATFTSEVAPEVVLLYI